MCFDKLILKQIIWHINNTLPTPFLYTSYIIMPLKHNDLVPLLHYIPHCTLSLEANTSQSNITPGDIHQWLSLTDVLGSYLVTHQITQQTVFMPMKSYEILVLKTNTKTEFILCDVFQIAYNDFFFMPNSNFIPGNLLSTHFQDTKLNWHLTCPPANDFNFATQHFSACIETLHSIERLIQLERNEECVSSVVHHLQNLQIKLMHNLFDVSTLPKSFLQFNISNISCSQKVQHQQMRIQLIYMMTTTLLHL